MTSGCCLTKSSIIPWVSCRLPATSRTLSTTGFVGFWGTSPVVAAPAWLLGELGAPQAARRPARSALEARTVVRWLMHMGVSLLQRRGGRRWPDGWVVGVGAEAVVWRASSSGGSSRAAGGLAPGAASRVGIRATGARPGLSFGVGRGGGAGGTLAGLWVVSRAAG